MDRQLSVRYVPLDSLKPYARNARTHSNAQISKLARSLMEFGWTVPMAVAGPEMIAGHGRLAAALMLRDESKTPPGLADRNLGPVIDLSHLTPAQRRAYVIADNKLALDAGWDNDLLAAELSELMEGGFQLALTGFEMPELTALFESRDGKQADPDSGTLLERINVTIADPRHLVAHGDHYLLGERHHLMCASVLTDWSLWSPLLREGAIFCPYPGPFVPYGDKAAAHMLVMVQSDPYIAGHILDRYEDCFGPSSIRKVAAAALAVAA